MKYIDADLLRKEIEKHIKEVKDAAERFTPNLGFFDAKLSGIYDVMGIIDSLQQEQQETPVIEVIARCGYESWMGGTMDDVRRDMVELGKVLNARKEE